MVKTTFLWKVLLIIIFLKLGIIFLFPQYCNIIKLTGPLGTEGLRLEGKSECGSLEVDIM
jgi:hypothetical protein